MNFMDLLPVDLIPELLMMAGVPYQKIVPSTDPNITLGYGSGRLCPDALSTQSKSRALALLAS